MIVFVQDTVHDSVIVRLLRRVKEEGVVSDLFDNTSVSHGPQISRVQ